MRNVADVAAIADPMERMTAAADLVAQADAKMEKLRTKRALAISVLLHPFADAVSKVNAARAEIRAAYESGDLTIEEYHERLAENREQRARDLEAAGVKVYPVDVYAMLGVGRSLVNRVLMRMPVDPPPPMRSPEKVARETHEQIGQLMTAIAEAREIRDSALTLLMSGHDENGDPIPPVSNADIARATRLTTARIAQLRESVAVS